MSEHQRDLRQLLIAAREDLDIELKTWLDLNTNEHRADLAKALLAMANHGGGFVIIGYEGGDGEHGRPSPVRPPSLADYTQDTINGIVRSYADPAFHCSVHHVQHPETGEQFPIIVVPQNLPVPVRSKRDGPNRVHVLEHTYYIRAAGPESRGIRSADEWNRLLQRCIRAGREDLIAAMRDLLSDRITPRPSMDNDHLSIFQEWVQESRRRLDTVISERLPDESPSRFRLGTRSVAYSVIGEIPPLHLSQLLEIVRQVKGRETGWPPFLDFGVHPHAPYAVDRVLECFLGSPSDVPPGNGAHSDFWRISPDGHAYFITGLQEDWEDSFQPGTALEHTVHIWRMAEILRHASRFARAVSKDPTGIMVYARWEGLKGRYLGSWDRGVDMGLPRQAHQDTVTVSHTFELDVIENNLAGAVHLMVEPLYEIFDFRRISIEFVQREIDRMLNRDR
jgi:hypothetical protein